MANTENDLPDDWFTNDDKGNKWEDAFLNKPKHHNPKYSVGFNVLQRYNSSSTTNVWEVRRSNRTDKIYCNCPGWTNYGHCKHLKDFRLNNPTIPDDEYAPHSKYINTKASPVNPYIMGVDLAKDMSKVLSDSMDASAFFLMKGMFNQSNSNKSTVETDIVPYVIVNTAFNRMSEAKVVAVAKSMDECVSHFMSLSDKERNEITYWTTNNNAKDFFRQPQFWKYRLFKRCKKIWLEDFEEGEFFSELVDKIKEME